MSESLLYVIPGDPVPLLRARMAKGRRPWDSQKQIKMHCGLQLTQQHGHRPPFQGALHFDVTFYFPFPQAISKAKLATMAGKLHTYRPDLSNLIKFIEDVATGILFNDDCLIASINAKKCYDHQPRTEFAITVLHAE